MSEPGRSVTRTDQMNTTDPPGRLPPPDHRGVTCPLPQTAPRPWRPHSARSTASSARARSCASATRAAPPSRSSRPARSPWTSRWGSARGRAVEIYGPESSGKTTLALHAVANAQKAGGIAAFIDAEHALDPEYAKHLGVDTDALLVSQPDTGEQALEIMDMLIRSGAIDVVVVDSVAALVPKAEIEGEMGDSHVGLQARLMSQALRKIAGALSNSGTTAIFVNQLREKIGVFFGSPETTTGGKALKFYASVRLDIRRIETLKEGTEAVGNRTRVKVVKNKMAPPFKQAEFDILYGVGISREGGLIDLGVEQGFVRKSGAWYTYEGDQLGQGKENARTFLKDNPDLADEIEKKIKEKLGIGARVDAPAETAGPVDF